MADEIETLLHRRTDLSTFLVHLTRDGGSTAHDNLIEILHRNRIEARTCYGMARDLASTDDHSPAEAGSDR